MTGLRSRMNAALLEQGLCKVEGREQRKDHCVSVETQAWLGSSELSAMNLALL